ncbi:hypothetical protein SAMN05421505_103289 [Sinosporangium album]|uniref:Uncharacterized protein n=1 Tax=Sinosporangium album TaxID=504805 RepID=A0A1G7TI93_9ACTN|nr:hypothetical protein [Sinosporangium album]SDG34975.1 hypothetical protein SAMN05421505_103289 [Sinosporangium album]
MAVEPVRVSMLAQNTRADARRMTEQALRLRDAAVKLRGNPMMPAWFEATVREQISRCMAAAAELEVAAQRMEEHAGDLLGRRRPR